MADTATNEAYASMASYMRSIGLGDLVSVGADGQPAGWLWNQLQSGVDTPSELQQAIEQTDLWKTRFAVIVDQRARAAKGEPVQVMSVDEVVAYENNARQIMRNAGLPATFYDSYQDFQKPIANGISISELLDRLGQAYERAAGTDPAIKAAFENFYGVGQGDGALAAYFLDPEHTINNLDKQSRTAYAAGLGSKYGIGLDKAQADQITTFAPTDAAVNQGLGQVAGMAGVLHNDRFEASQLSTDTGVQSVFANDALATRQINQRLTERRAGNNGAIGGAALTNQGLLGAGSAST